MADNKEVPGVPEGNVVDPPPEGARADPAKRAGPGNGEPEGEALSALDANQGAKRPVASWITLPKQVKTRRPRNAA